MTTPQRWFEGIMYTAYGDESADETQQRVFSLAGLFGSAPDWRAFNKQWKARTGGTIFHAAACDSDRGDYKNSDHKANKKLYADLSHIIAESPLLGNAVSISLPDYKELLAPCLDENPYYLLFQHVIINLARRSSVCLPRDHIKFVFDRNVEIQHNASALYDRSVNGQWSTAEYRQLMEDELGFATRKTIGIQAADLIAREAMKLLDNRSGPKSRPTRLATQALWKSGRIKFRIYDRRWCEGIIRDSKDAQYPKTEYFTWLEEHGLTHTLANKIRYESTIPFPSSLPSVLKW
jgi:hypothetical protein